MTNADNKPPRLLNSVFVVRHSSRLSSTEPALYFLGLSLGRLRMKALSALLAIALAIAAYFYLHRPITYPAGLLIESEPQQLALEDGVEPISFLENIS